MQILTKNQDLKTISIIAGIFFIVVLLLGLNRHLSFYSSYDQGLFNQVFWNSTQGNFFQSSLSSQLSTNVVHSGEVPDVSYHHLGQHFTPAFLLWLPIYYLFPTATTLTVIMTVVVTSAGIVLYFLAREYLNPKLAGMITVSFYCAITILGPTLCNFHAISQMPLLIFSLLLAMEKRNWWLFTVLAIITLTVREDSAIALFGIGFYLVASRRYPRIGLSLCGVSVIYLLTSTNLIMPLFSDDVSKRFMLEKFGQYAEGEEASTLEILWGMLTNPLLLLKEIFTPIDDTIFYLLGHWLPFAFIPAFSPTSWLISAFPILKLFVGQGKSVLALNIRYSMNVVPGLCYGAILWWAGQGFKNFNENLATLQPRKLTRKFQRFWLFCLSVSLILTFVYSTTELSRVFYFALPNSWQPMVYVTLPRQWHHAGNIYSLLAKIPDSASVSATNNIIPHLSSRRAVLRLPMLKFRNDQDEVVNVDYIIADVWELERYGVIFGRERTWLEEIQQLFTEIRANQEYQLIDERDGVMLWQKIS